MKTSRDYILEIITNKSNLQHIADSGKINGSLLIDIEKVMKLYANAKIDYLANEIELLRKEQIIIQSEKENNQDILFIEGKIRALRKSAVIVKSLKDEI